MRILERLLVLSVLAALLVVGIARICDRQHADRPSKTAPAHAPNPRCLVVTHIGSRYHNVVEIILCNDQWDHDYNSTQEMRQGEPKEAEHVLGWVKQFRVTDAELDNIVAGLRMHWWGPETRPHSANLQLDHLIIIDGIPYVQTFKAVSGDDLRAAYRILLSEELEPDARKAIEYQSQEFASVK